MTHPVTDTRERVVDAAFELIREGGWSSVTARSIAERLGSSTMPIYSHLRSIAEVERALRAKARTMLKEFQSRPWTDDVLLNLAFGYIAFARDERHLFRFLYIDRPDVIAEREMSGMKGFFDQEFADRPEVSDAVATLGPGLDSLVEHSWIFTHGLAMLLSSGSIGHCTDERILELLQNAGQAFCLLVMDRAAKPMEKKNDER
jgi:AcrR family transcriptional regulator